MTGWHVRTMRASWKSFATARPGGARRLKHSRWVSVLAGSAPPRAAPSAASEFDYAEALQGAMFFYQAQRSGQLPPDNEVAWRGDSDLADGSDNGVNLAGGYHDAGDLVKFGLPEAWAMNMLAWSLLDYQQGYAAAGQYQATMGCLVRLPDRLSGPLGGPQAVRGCCWPGR